MRTLQAEQAIKALQEKFEAGEVKPVEALTEMSKVLATLQSSLGRGHDDIDWVNRGGQW